MRFPPPIAGNGRLFLLWAALSLILLWLSWQQALNSLSSQLQQQLSTELLPKIIADSGYRIGQYYPDEALLERINHDLQHIPLLSRLPLIRHCRIELSALHGQQTEGHSAATRDIILQRHTSEGSQTFVFQLWCEANYPVWIGSQLAISTLACLLILLLPRPFTAGQRRWLQQLQQHGLSPQEARQMLPDLLQQTDAARHTFLQLTASGASAQQALQILQQARQPDLHWLQTALKHHPGDLNSALQIACSPDELTLYPQQNRITLHGLSLQLPVTPFLYYLWYAQLRKQQADQGWFINPPTNRPDHENARRIAALMSHWGGHGKAINDLSSHGLKAKTLDQNRSKIKDELVSAVGEELAAPYLFEAERDPASGRSRYRISLPPEQINILSAAPQAGFSASEEAQQAIDI